MVKEGGKRKKGKGKKREKRKEHLQYHVMAEYLDYLDMAYVTSAHPFVKASYNILDVVGEHNPPTEKVSE